MTKLVKIDTCDECPEFEDEFRDMPAYCRAISYITTVRYNLNRDNSGEYEIPKDCPLENV